MFPIFSGSKLIQHQSQHFLIPHPILGIAKMPDIIISNGGAVIAPSEAGVIGMAPMKPEKAETKVRRFYKADDPIPWSLAILFGFQVSYLFIIYC